MTAGVPQAAKIFGKMAGDTVEKLVYESIAQWARLEGGHREEHIERVLGGISVVNHADFYYYFLRMAAALNPHGSLPLLNVAEMRAVYFILLDDYISLLLRLFKNGGDVERSLALKQTVFYFRENGYLQECCNILKEAL